MADARLAAEVAAMAHTLILVLSVETNRTLLHTRVVQKETWLVAVEAVVFAGPRASMAG